MTRQKSIEQLHEDVQVGDQIVLILKDTEENIIGFVSRRFNDVNHKRIIVLGSRFPPREDCNETSGYITERCFSSPPYDYSDHQIKSYEILRRSKKNSR